MDSTYRLVSETLATQGYEILEASDGEAALDLARRMRPQLVLLDVVMPRLDGLEVCRRLKADPSLRGIKVVMLTGKSSPVDWIHGKAAGADEYLTKPFSPPDLVSLVARLVQ
ncbi:MAG: response regulator [Chloroflexi bacterium]|nr:response regulator [Chloroflexota bacterium]